MLNHSRQLAGYGYRRTIQGLNRPVAIRSKCELHLSSLVFEDRFVIMKKRRFYNYIIISVEESIKASRTRGI